MKASPIFSVAQNEYPAPAQNIRTRKVLISKSQDTPSLTRPEDLREKCKHKTWALFRLSGTVVMCSGNFSPREPSQTTIVHIAMEEGGLVALPPACQSYLRCITPTSSLIPSSLLNPFIFDVEIIFKTVNHEKSSTTMLKGRSMNQDGSSIPNSNSNIVSLGLRASVRLCKRSYN